MKSLEKLLEHSIISHAKVVAAFYPMANEPDITSALKIWASESRLLLPRSLPFSQMDFFQVNSLESDLQKGKFGIMEPKETLPKYQGEIPVFLVPGTKFSLDGARYGHGMGYYDRFLGKYPHSFKIGICYLEQVSETPLQVKPHDVFMDEVVIFKKS